MKKHRSFSRLGLALLVLALVTAGLAFPATRAKAIDADTFYLSWPYEAPPKGNLNSFSPDALTNGGFGMWSYLLEPTFGYYEWATGQYKGWLAKEFGFSADGKKYTIKLRDDLTWSDGSKLTSKDVVSTYTILLSAGGNGEYGNGLDHVVAVDDHTVDFILNKPPSVLLERLIMKELVTASSVYGQFSDAFQKVIDANKGKSQADISATDDWKKVEKNLEDFRPDHVVSSGPYTLDAKDISQAQITMRRTDKTAFGKLAKYDKIAIYNGDTDVTTPLILSGELYYATDYFPPATEKTMTDKGIKILRAPTFSGPGILFNVATPGLNKVEVRQAIAYAVDRARATKVAYGDIGKPVKYMADFSDAQVPNYMSADDIKKLNTYDLDLKKADDLLQKAGYKKDGDVYKDRDGKALEFELSAPSDYTDWMPAAQDVADQLTAFGIKITLRAIPDSQHRPEIRDGKFQMAIRLWGYPNALPFYAFRYTYLQNSVGGKATAGTGYAHKQTIGGKDIDFDQLVTAIGAGTDPAPQKAAVTAAALAFNQDLPMVPLIERYYNCPLITTNIDGLPPDSDPIWQNVSGSDNAIVVLLMEGKIGPKKK